MTVRVKLFAVARERIGRDELVIELPQGATIAGLKRFIASEYPPLDTILPHAFWAVNAQYANDDTPVTDRSEIALIPPVSGG
jgi:molybdopterin converting factor subunit 1